MAKPRVHVVGGGGGYIAQMFMERGWEVVGEPWNADLVQFTGGADVTPSYYGQEAHPATFNDPARDKRESTLYQTVRENRIPMAGICRGGQFLWVMNGGSLYQHVDGHAIAGTHPVYKEGAGERSEEFICNVTSTHHQMMRLIEPWDSGSKLDPNAHILAFGRESTTKEWMTYTEGMKQTLTPDDWYDFDIEVAHFKDTNCLCFQPHPEHPEAECRDYYFELIRDYLVKEG